MSGLEALILVPTIPYLIDNVIKIYDRINNKLKERKARKAGKGQGAGRGSSKLVATEQSLQKEVNRAQRVINNTYNFYASRHGPLYAVGDGEQPLSTAAVA